MAKYSNNPMQVGRSAHFSPCRLYRYSLDITWDSSKPRAAFIGLNPSTADEVQDDPTVRRCRGFAEREGCGGMRMLNIFGFRATKPKDMLCVADPAGPGNDVANLGRMFEECAGPWVACWGAHGRHLGRGAEVLRAVHGLRCLGVNQDGSPKHPLYVRGDSVLLPYG